MTTVQVHIGTWLLICIAVITAEIHYSTRNCAHIHFGVSVSVYECKFFFNSVAQYEIYKMLGYVVGIFIQACFKAFYNKVGFVGKIS